MKLTIYLSESTREKLKEIQQKYRLSISTISQILTDEFKHNFAVYDITMFTQYLDKNHRKKTMIKPNNIDDLMKRTNNNLALLSHFYSNILYLWCKPNLNYLFNESNDKKVVEYRKTIEKTFHDTKEARWNENNDFRMLCRLARKHKDYFKKYMGETA